MSKTKKNIKRRKDDIIDKIGKIPVKYLALVIFLIAFALYARTIDFDYVYCDDNLFCLKFEEQNEDIGNVINAFSETLAYGSMYYRPILRITFILENQIAGTSPYIYHLSNVLFHSVGAMMVFLVLMQLNYTKMTSLVFGVLFAVHPVITPAATWISGRNDSLITIFILLSFIFMIKYLNRKNISSKYLILNYLFFAFSLFTKETAALFPIASIAYIALFRKETLFEKRKYYLYVGWFLIGLLWFIMRQLAISGFDSPDKIGIGPFVEKFPVIFSLFSKMIIPLRLAPLSDIHWMTTVLGIIAIGGIMIYTFSSKKIDRRKVLFGLIWYILFLFPSLIVRLFDDFFDYAEHRAYLLLVGFFIIAIEVIKSLKISFRDKRTLAVAGIVIVAFSALAIIYQGKMQNKFNFWLNIRKNFPAQQKAYIMLGEHYQKMDSLRPALIYFKKAFDLGEPTYNLYVNTSAIYLKYENYKEAEKFARQAVKIDSGGVTGFYNLAKALTGQKRYKEATHYYQKALKGRDSKESWYIDLGNNLFYAGEFRKAAEVFENALKNLKDRSNLGALYSNLGSSYANLKENEKAEDLFIKALEVTDDKETALINLVLFYSINKVDPEKAYYYANQMRKMGYKIPPSIQRLLQKIKEQ